MRRRILGAGLLAVMLALGAPTSVAQDEGDKGEIPVHGSFTYRKANIGRNVQIIGAVHGVRRVDGATAVYYSVGTPSSADKGIGAINGFEAHSTPYKLGQAAMVSVVDTAALKAYRPLLVDGSGGLVSDVVGMKAGPGDLRVLYALLPELPATTTAVDVQFEGGASVTGVPVEDGALLPEVQADVAPLGEGWPALPGAQLIAQADPAASTYELMERTSDLERASETSETSEEVSVTLAADFFFDSAEWTLSDKGVKKVEAIAAEIAERGASEVTVTGYTDSVPDKNIGNDELSKRRAQTVAKLIEKGAPGVKIKAEGRGTADPVASNSNDEGRAQNRRVTVDYEVNQ